MRRRDSNLRVQLRHANNSALTLCTRRLAAEIHAHVHPIICGELVAAIVAKIKKEEAIEPPAVANSVGCDKGTVLTLQYVDFGGCKSLHTFQ